MILQCDSTILLLVNVIRNRPNSEIYQSSRFKFYDFLLLTPITHKAQYKKRALEGNRTPVRGSTIPYTNHCTTKATQIPHFFL